LLDYLEGQVPEAGFLFGEIGLADIAIASFFRNAFYAGFAIDGTRWPKTTAFVGRTLAHDCFARFKPFEDAQISTDPKGRRAALLAAGAPLTETSLGTRQPVKGMMRL
jgi:glutathione S-transferase